MEYKTSNSRGIIHGCFFVRGRDWNSLGKQDNECMRINFREVLETRKKNGTPSRI
jgi:hypothetical protein